MEIVASPVFDIQQIVMFLVILFIASCALLVIVVTALVAFFVFHRSKANIAHREALEIQKDLDESLARNFLETDPMVEAKRIGGDVKFTGGSAGSEPNDGH